MKLGTLRYSEPKLRNSTCSTTRAMARLIISTANCDLRMGRISTRSTTMPNSATPNTTRGVATTKGMLKTVVSK
jgi:hypothetical protein